MVQDVFEHLEFQVRECLAVVRCKREHWCDGIDEACSWQVVDRAVIDNVLCGDVSKREVVAILAFRPA